MRSLFAWVAMGLCGCGGMAAVDGGAPADAGRDAHVAPGTDAGSIDAGRAENDAGPSGIDGGEVWPVLPECRSAISDVLGAEDMLAGSSGDVSYRLWRCNLNPEIASSTQYRGDAFELTFGGRTYRTYAVTYTSSHHNWTDSLSATDPEATMTWRNEYQIATGQIFYYVSARATAGSLEETQVF